jgi:hypothetical protein
LKKTAKAEKNGKKIYMKIKVIGVLGGVVVGAMLGGCAPQAPEPIIDQYLINEPHWFFKVYGLGDMYAPKNVSLQEDQRYQNVRIIAVYDTNQIPALRS